MGSLAIFTLAVRRERPCWAADQLLSGLRAIGRSHVWFTWLVAILIAQAAAAPPTHAAKAAAAQISIFTDLSYGPRADQKLDLCVPADRPDAGSVVLIIHGGGWHAGVRTGHVPLCRKLAQRGVAAINVDYRLSDGTPTAAWPVQLDDVESALRWLIANGPHYGVSVRHACAIGFSAGAHIAAFLALSENQHPDIALDPGRGMLRLSCLVDAFGPVDLTAFEGPPVRRLIELLVATRDPTELERRARAASPLFLPMGAAPSTLVIQGTNDAAVPRAQAEDFVAALRHAGKSPKLILYPGEHNFKGLNVEQRRQILDEALTFLTGHIGG